jgi:hypothetical protein
VCLWAYHMASLDINVNNISWTGCLVPQLIIFSLSAKYFLYWASSVHKNNKEPPWPSVILALFTIEIGWKWTRLSVYIETPASPSAKCTRGRPQNTRGRLPRVQHSGKASRGRFSWGSCLPRVPNLVHLGKPSLSVMPPLGDDLTSSAPSPVFF